MILLKIICNIIEENKIEILENIIIEYKKI